MLFGLGRMNFKILGFGLKETVDVRKYKNITKE